MSKQRLIRHIDLLSSCALKAQEHGRYGDGTASGLMTAAVWLAEDLGIVSKVPVDYFEKKEAA